MRELVYVKGDLTQATESMIAHGCNAQGVMGSGVAKAIRVSFPHAYECYRRQYEEYGRLAIGDVIFAPCGDKIIANCITQKYYGRQVGKIYMDYAALRKCMVLMNDFAKTIKRIQHLDSLSIAMPLIGAGFGGGNWSKISRIILDESSEFNVVIYTI